MSGHDTASMGGAVVGAGVGTAIAPGVGTLAGAGLGYMAGGTLYDAFTGGDGNPWDPNANPGVAELNNDRFDATRQQQMGLMGGYQQNVDMMRQAAMGNAPSAAQMQMQQGLGQAQGNALNIAANARGGSGNQLLATRDAMAANASMANQVNQQSAALRAQEMAQARQGLLAAQAQQGDYMNQLQGQNIQYGGLDANYVNQQRQINAGMYNNSVNADQSNTNSQREQNSGIMGGMFKGAGSAIGMGLL